MLAGFGRNDAAGLGLDGGGFDGFHVDSTVLEDQTEQQAHDEGHCPKHEFKNVEGGSHFIHSGLVQITVDVLFLHRASVNQQVQAADISASTVAWARIIAASYR
jgi:hypothetical protein